MAGSDLDWAERLGEPRGRRYNCNAALVDVSLPGPDRPDSAQLDAVVGSEQDLLTTLG